MLLLNKGSEFMESKKEMTNFKLNEELKKFYENYSLMMSEINKRFQELFKALEPFDKLTQSFKNISEKFNNYNLPKIDLSPLAKSLKVLNDYSKRVSYEEVKVESITTFHEIEQDGCYYRGQADVDWPLIPSFFRNIQKKLKDDITRKLSSDKIYEMCTDEFKDKLDPNKDDIFNLAKTQHEYDNNPVGTILLDITSDFWASVFFAIHNKDDENKNFAIYRFKCLNQNSCIKDIKEANEYIKNITYFYVNGEKEENFRKSFDELIPAEYGYCPNGKIIDISEYAQDISIRMRRQKGIFFCFGKMCIGLQFNSNVSPEALPFNKKNIKSDFEIIKYNISKDLLCEIKEEMEKRDNYTEEYLLP